MGMPTGVVPTRRTMSPGRRPLVPVLSRLGSPKCTQGGWAEWSRRDGSSSKGVAAHGSPTRRSCAANLVRVRLPLVVAVAPAVVKTRFATALYEGREEQVSQAYPLKRLGEPDDIGSVVAFLLSADAGWMTGQTLVVDGGVLLGGGA